MLVTNNLLSPPHCLLSYTLLDSVKYYVTIKFPVHVVLFTFPLFCFCPLLPAIAAGATTTIKSPTYSGLCTRRCKNCEHCGCCVYLQCYKLLRIHVNRKKATQTNGIPINEPHGLSKTTIIVFGEALFLQLKSL